MYALNEMLMNFFNLISIEYLRIVAEVVVV